MVTFKDALRICEEIEPGSTEQFRELPKISVVGCFQNGKSTFINCLLNDLVARPGDGRATTKISTRYRWGESTNVNFRTNQGLQSVSLREYLKCINLSQISEDSAFQAEITLNKQILKKIELIDTPGFNAEERDTEYVTRSLDEANYAIVVLTNERTLGEAESAMFECIKSKSIPYAIIMNCRNINTPMEWYPSHKKNIEIIKTNEAKLEQWGYFPDKIDGHLIYPCNLLWYWFAVKHKNFSFLSSDGFEEDLADQIEFSFMLKREVYSKENIIDVSNFVKIKSFFIDRLAYIN